MTWTYINDDPATLPPIDVPVLAVYVIGDCPEKFCALLERGMFDSETWVWGHVYEAPAWTPYGWAVNGTEADDDYRVIAWHPLPDPTEVMR